MTIRERVLASRLIPKLEKNKALVEAAGIEYKSIMKNQVAARGSSQHASKKSEN